MNAERDYLLDELGDSKAPIGSKSWALWLHNETRKTFYDKQRADDRLRDLVSLSKDNEIWRILGESSWETYCERRLQARAEEIEREATRRTVEAAKKAPALLAQTGRPAEASLPKDYNGYNYNQSVKSGTSPEYLAARIARDRPDILERMKAGEYRSVRAAAIDAGIIDPEKARRYQLPTDPTKAGEYLAGRVDAEWMLACYEAFTEATAAK